MTRLKSLVPPALRPLLRGPWYALYRASLRARCRLLDVQEAGRRDDVPVPPAALRFRVSENLDRDTFLNVGKRACADIAAALAQAGRPLETCADVLDFGCGCGRALVWLVRAFPGTHFAGCDVDGDAVAWCRANVAAAAFAVNGPLPPLPYPDASFDAVYGISVFTHLSDEYQRRWLPELRRVLRPGGVLLLTVHAEHVSKRLAGRDAETLEREGHLFQTSNKLAGILPDWYQTAFQKRSYLVAMFQEHFTDVRCLDRAMGDQDAIVARTSRRAS